jgi:hypothetical protein
MLESGNWSDVLEEWFHCLWSPHPKNFPRTGSATTNWTGSISRWSLRIGIIQTLINCFRRRKCLATPNSYESKQKLGVRRKIPDREHSKLKRHCARMKIYQNLIAFVSALRNLQRTKWLSLATSLSLEVYNWTAQLLSPHRTHLRLMVFEISLREWLQNVLNHEKQWKCARDFVASRQIFGSLSDDSIEFIAFGFFLIASNVSASVCRTSFNDSGPQNLW